MAADKGKPEIPSNLLWVNHDAQHMQSRPHRQRVFSHIQQQYRPWQRRTSALGLKKSVKGPTTGSIWASVDSEEDRSDYTGTSPASSCTTSDRSPPRSMPVQLYHGNSDPFNALPFKVSAKVNDILKFYRDIVLPSQYHTAPDGWLTLEAAAEDWRYVVRSLQEKGGALGFLARWSQVASDATGNSELALQSLRFRAQSTSDLLKRLQQGSGIASRSSYWHIIALYMAEVQAGNANAAWVHGAMLSKALKHESEHGQVDITSLRSFMYNEACACCVFLRKPVLDYGDWIVKVFEKPWAEGREQLPAMQLSFSTNLDASIEDAFLKDMFILQREGLATWRHGSERAEGLSPEVFTWWCSSHLVKHTRLLKYALDSIDASKELKGAQPHVLRKNAYLALSAVYWTRLIAGDETLLGKEIFQTKPPLRRLTRELLEQDRQRIEFTGSMQYANARLFALYIGAQAEHDQSGVPRADESWFSNEFSHQAARMKLYTWDVVRKILDGFLDCDIVEPHGSQFVPSLLLQRASTKEGDGIKSLMIPQRRKPR